jgi:hypothetical protein
MVRVDTQQRKSIGDEKDNGDHKPLFQAIFGVKFRGKIGL